MEQSQIERIKVAEETAKEFIRAAEDVRKELATVEDPKTRQQLIEAVSDLEQTAEQLWDALRGMRKSLQ